MALVDLNGKSKRELKARLKDIESEIVRRRKQDLREAKRVVGFVCGTGRNDTLRHFVELERQSIGIFEERKPFPSEFIDSDRFDRHAPTFKIGIG